MRAVWTSVPGSVRLPLLYAVPGFLAIAVYVTLPYNLKSAVTYDVLAGSSVFAVLAGIWIHRPARMLPWLLVAGGLASFVAGEITWHVYWFGLGQDPFPSLADLFYLAGYPLLAAGLLVLARDRGAQHGQGRAGFIDAMIVTVGAFAIAWTFLMLPYAADESLPVLDRVLSTAYPLMDILLLTLLVRLLFTPGRRSPAMWLLAAGMAFFLVGDITFLAFEVAGKTTGVWIEGVWLLAYFAVGTAALHPSMAAPPAPARGPERLTVWRLGALGLAAITGPAVLTVEALSGNNDGIVVILICSAILPVLVLLRLAGLVRELERAGEERGRLYESERAALAEAEAAQRLLLEQNDRLRELDRLKDEFVALVSHELRTPLTSITGYLELVLDDSELVPEHRRFLEVVDRNAGRLLRLVSDLLLVAQIESGKLVLEPEDVDLADLATHSVEALRPAADARNIDLRLDAHPVPNMTGDPARLGQLLDNLLSNAVKFTEDGGRVVVALGVRGDDLVLAVSDNGIGIPVAEQRRLFDRFFRATTAQDRAIEGTGLGLTIVHAIVRAHGGAIEVTSDEGQGTTFRVRLPVAGPTAEQAGSPDRSAQTVI
ncbi:MAG: sensor histidine kinase [Gaiellaceae bacterium]